jgi:2-haloacid dehalogenase
VKPREDIYARVEGDCGVEPQALLFTDDMPKNIAAAQARGWQTHQFDGPQGWAERLVSDGLVTSDQAA